MKSPNHTVPCAKVLKTFLRSRLGKVKFFGDESDKKKNKSDVFTQQKCRVFFKKKSKQRRRMALLLKCFPLSLFLGSKADLFPKGLLSVSYKGEVARKHKRRTTSQTFPGSRGNAVHPAFFCYSDRPEQSLRLALSPHKVSDILLPTKYLSFWLMSRSVQKIPFQAYQYKKAALKLGVPKPSIFFPRHWSGLWPL